MIVSHRHKFIFVKTRKTAGTSIEVALSEICGPDDIITPILPDEEEYRTGLGYRGKQNFLVPRSKYGIREWGKSLLKWRWRRFYDHMPAAEIRKYVDREVWDTYYKFTFDRNPFDKLISLYYWSKSDQKYANLTEYIKSGDALRARAWDFYTENDKLIVDKVYKFENVAEALKDISDRIGLDKTLEPPNKKIKGNVRKNKDHYSQVLTPFERDWISEHFAPEMELLDYTFEEKPTSLKEEKTT